MAACHSSILDSRSDVDEKHCTESAFVETRSPTVSPAAAKSVHHSSRQSSEMPCRKKGNRRMTLLLKRRWNCTIWPSFFNSFLSLGLPRVSHCVLTGQLRDSDQVPSANGMCVRGDATYVRFPHEARDEKNKRAGPKDRREEQLYFGAVKSTRRTDTIHLPASTSSEPKHGFRTPTRLDSFHRGAMFLPIQGPRWRRLHGSKFVRLALE